MASAAEPRSEAPSRYQSLALLLPIEVKIVESYMTWMEELADHVEKSAYSKASSLDNYIKLILEEDKAQRNEDGNEDEDSDWNDNVGHVAMKMNVAAMYTYIGDFESAEAQLGILKNGNLEKLNLTEKHKDVILYFRDSLVWAIGVLTGLEQEKNGNKYTFLIQGSSKLNCRWEALNEDGDEQIKATLAFMKACLSSAMKVSEDVTLDLLIEATRLDPQCYIWFHYAYRIMRRIRRNIKRSSSSRVARPSDEEKRLAKTAYELCPEDVVAITDYALFLKEMLWMEHYLVWEKNEADYLKCVELFQKALKLANDTENKKWSRKIKVYLAEFLSFGKGEKLDQDAGKRMFDECAIEYPTSTFVLHKVGKLYHHGLHRINGHDGKCIDLQRAKECYKQAIASNPGNYACLMDYLKLLQRLKEYAEMMNAIETALEQAKRDYQVAKLHIAKGYITWIWNPRGVAENRSLAVASWMHVLKNLAEFSNDIYYANDAIFFDREHSSHLVKSEIMKHLDNVSKYCYVGEDLSLIEAFIEGLSKFLNRERKPKMNWGNARKPAKGNAEVEGDANELSAKMKGLGVSSRANYQRQTQGESNWRKTHETSPNEKKENESQPRHFEADHENKRIGRNPRRSDADEDDAWRNKN